MAKLRSFSFGLDSLDLQFENVSAEEALAIIQSFTGSVAPMDRALADSLRPGGTPVDERHRRLEDAAEASGGKLVVTHAAGGEPVLAPAEEAPEPIPEAEPAPKTASKNKNKSKSLGADALTEEVGEPGPKEPEEEKRPGLDPKKVQWDDEPPVTVKWMQIGKYGPSKILQVTVDMDGNAELTLDRGEIVTVSRDGHEIGRRPVPKEDPSQSAIGDFRPQQEPEDVIDDPLPTWAETSEPGKLQLTQEVVEGKTLKHVILALIEQGAEEVSIQEVQEFIAENAPQIPKAAASNNVRDSFKRVIQLVADQLSEKHQKQIKELVNG